MPIVKPIELTPGLARNQTLTGRVCLLDSATVGKAGRANDYVELHLVVEEGLSGTRYIVAWRDQARRPTQVAHDGKILKLTNLTIKALGEKAQWQCTPLDIYGQVLATTRLVADSDQYPANVHTVLLSDLPMHTHMPHLVNLTAVFVEGQQATSTKATAPAFNLLMADKGQSVRVALWKDHAGNLDVAKLATTKKGQAIILTSLRVTKSKESTTELGTSKRTRVLQAPQAMAALLQARLEQQSEWTPLSRTVGYTDYSQASGTPMHLRALASLIVPQTARDFAGEVFEVFHCLVEDLEPLPDAEDIFYEGCPICKKKRGPESTCKHQEPLVRVFLAHCSLVTFEGRAQGRVIGQVLQDMLGVPAADCAPDAEGYSATAMDTLRGTPYNMKFIIGKIPAGTKHVLELVHASPTLGHATFQPNLGAWSRETLLGSRPAT